MKNKPALWAQDISAAANAVQKLCPDAAKAAAARADEICEGVFIFRDHWEMERADTPVHFDSKDNLPSWEASPNGDPEWVYALNRHTVFVNLAKAWRYTNNRKYLNAFVRLINNWIDTQPHTKQREQTSWRALEAGLRAENWLRALALFGDAVPADLIAKINASLISHAEWLVSAHGAFQRLSNWGAIQSHGLFLIGMWLNNAEWQALALNRLAENLQNAVLADGVQWEQSPMYHCEVLHSAADTVLIARQNNIDVPPQLLHLTQKMCEALTAWVTPNFYILPQSDSDEINASDLICAGALLFDTPTLAAAAQRADLLEETLWDCGADAPARIAALKAQYADNNTASTALAASGNYILRSSRKKTAAYVHMHSGSLGGGHGHADLLHIDVYKGAQGILTDAGRYTYVDGEMRRLLKSPAAHNTLRLDGADFTQYKDTWGWQNVAQPLPTSHMFTPEADSLCAAHLGYIEKGVTLRRRVFFVKPSWVIIEDSIFAPQNAAHTLEQFFHFEKGVLKQDGDAAIWQSENAAQKAAFYILSGQKAEAFTYERSPHYNELQGAPALCLAAETIGTASLLTALYIGDDAENAKVEKLAVTDGAGAPVAAEFAEALKLTDGADGENSAMLIISHKAGAHEAALLCAGGFSGHGTALFFTKDAPCGISLT